MVRGHDHGRVAVLRHQGGQAQAEDHGAGTADDNGLVQVVDAGGEDEVLTQGQRGGDGQRRGGRAGHEELRQGHGRAGLVPARPGRAGRAVLDRGHEHVVVAARVGEQERLFLGHRAGGQHRVLLALAGEDRRGRALHPGVDHVPQAVRAPGRPADGAVADQELLVAEEVEVAAYLAVGDEAAAGEVVVRAVVLEDDAAVDDGAPDRRGLGGRPHLRRVGAAGTERIDDRRRVGRRRAWQVHVEGQIGQRPPEVVIRIAVLCACGTQVVEHVDGTVDHRVLRHRAQARDLGVVADLEDQRAGGRPVGAGAEQDRVPLAVELAGHRDLLGGDAVEIVLDGGLAHGVGEDTDIGAERGYVRVRADGRRLRYLGRDLGESRPGDQRRRGQDRTPPPAGGKTSGNPAHQLYLCSLGTF